MEEAIAELLAKQEITETLYRVARGTDRGDVELYGSGFHEDGEDYHGLVNGPVRKILDNLASSKLLFTQHAISNVLIEFEDANTAWVESCFSSSHQGRNANGSLRDEAIRGRYFDRFEQRGGPWKIARRAVLWDWSQVLPSADDTWIDMMRRRPGTEDKFIFGRRDREDMIYTRELPAGFN
jgi:hypothetical protein